MATARTRPLITEATSPRLPPYVRLQHEKVRDAWALLSPEKVMWPDDISLDILRRCDGKTSVASIITDLASDYDAAEDTVRDDVIAFLQTWTDMRLIAP
jgi:pyrroloquinoline quinone biosynthesis protein D